MFCILINGASINGASINGLSVLLCIVCHYLVKGYFLKLSYQNPFWAVIIVLLKIMINLPNKIKHKEMPTITWNDKNKTSLNYVNLPCTINKIKYIEEIIADESQVHTNEALNK